MTAVGDPKRGILHLKWQGKSTGRKIETQKKYPGLPEKSLAQKLAPINSQNKRKFLWQ